MEKTVTPQDPPPTATVPDATATQPAQSAVSLAAPASSTSNPPLEKSAELRFVETNADLICFEHTKKRPPNAKEHAEILRHHGFGGRGGDEMFVEFSIRGEKDREWGRRTAERIKDDTQALCPR